MAGLSRQTNLARPCGKEFRYILVFGRNNIFVFSKKNLLIILLSVVNGFGKRKRKLACYILVMILGPFTNGPPPNNK